MSPAVPIGRVAAGHWPLPAVCALFLLAGALALDDYGFANDEENQRAIGKAALDYLAGDGERAFDDLLNAPDRYYGPAFEAPLVLVERILGLSDSRDVYLSRRILTHLFFLAGGVFCYLLAIRMFNSRALALAALILFLLHPRIYAHSFFNTKDVPFLVMFMISLFLIHRAFRRDTLGAFVLCGVGAGLLLNLRITGIILVAAVLVLRGLDLIAGERRRVLLTGVAFALAAALTYHATSPVLWTDPVGRLGETLRVFGAFPQPSFHLFRGEWLYAPNGPPFDYVPVWVGITTPPAILLAALAGAAALAWRGLRRPLVVLHNGPLRFSMLLLMLPVATGVAVVALESNIYNGWRHLYFLHAPLLLLAIIGIQWLASPGRGAWTRTGAYALTGAAVAVTVVSMLRIHPHQDSYFTLLADRTTPERLASRYDVNYWDQSAKSMLDDIVGDHPSGRLFTAIPRARARWLLPTRERERFTATHAFRSGDANFHEVRNRRACPAPAPAGSSISRLYATTLYCVVDPVAYFGDLRREALATEPLARSRLDAYRVGDLMVYVRDECSGDDASWRIFLRVFPANPADLPDHSPGFPRHRTAYGFEHRDFDFATHGARIDGNCVAAVPLPDYAITSIHTGQYAPERATAALRAVADGEPLARSRFDIHRNGRALTYVRRDCSASDAGTRFFLHVFLADADDLPVHRREHGFDNLDFSLREYGARTDGGGCAATVPLPAYSIARIHTGQFTASGARWTVGFNWSSGE